MKKGNLRAFHINGKAEFDVHLVADQKAGVAGIGKASIKHGKGLNKGLMDIISLCIVLKLLNDYMAFCKLKGLKNQEKIQDVEKELGQMLTAYIQKADSEGHLEKIGKEESFTPDEDEEDGKEQLTKNEIIKRTSELLDLIKRNQWGNTSG